MTTANVGEEISHPQKKGSGLIMPELVRNGTKVEPFCVF
jgi:hypothetical protein